MKDTSKIKFWKSVEWLRPFINSGNGLVPLHKIREVMGFKVALHKQTQSAATTIKFYSDRGGSATYFKITINTHDYTVKTLGNGKFKKVDHRELSMSYVLDSLAHELAHLKYWEHSPEHLVLQCRIMARMAKVAGKKGITDLSVKASKYKQLLSHVKDEQTPSVAKVSKKRKRIK